MSARSTRHRPMLVAAAVTVVAALGLAAPAAAAGALTYPLEIVPGVTVVTPHPDYALEVACEDVLEDVELTVFAVPAGSLTVDFDCLLPSVTADTADSGLAGEYPAGFDDVVVGSATQLTIDPNTTVMSAVNGSADVVITYLATVPYDDPSGRLLSTGVVTIPASGTQLADFSSIVDPSGDCSGWTGGRVYGTLEFTVETSGEYTFRVVEVSPAQGPLGSLGPNPWGGYVPISDPLAFLYAGTFDPADAATGIIGCNDDSDAVAAVTGILGAAHDSQGRYIDPYYPEIVAELVPGTYTVVLTTNDAETVILPPDPSSVAVEEPVVEGSALQPAYVASELPELSGTVEIWSTEPELAATGADRVFLIALGAVLLMLIGASALVVRRG